MHRLGNSSVKEFMHALKYGEIKNSSITTKNVYRAVDIYGPSLAMLKGSTARHKPDQVKADAVVQCKKA